MYTDIPNTQIHTNVQTDIIPDFIKCLLAGFSVELAGGASFFVTNQDTRNIKRAMIDMNTTVLDAILTESAAPDSLRRELLVLLYTYSAPNMVVATVASAAKLIKAPVIAVDFPSRDSLTVMFVNTAYTIANTIVAIATKNPVSLASLLSNNFGGTNEDIYK